MDQLDSYWQKVAGWCRPFLLTSRVHELRGFQGASVKRDDELSFGVSGSKLRKWASVMASLRAEGIEEVVLSGSALANNVLAALQLLREAGIRPALFLKRSHQLSGDGNAFWFRLLKGDAHVVMLGSDEWEERLKREEDYLTAQRAAGRKIMRFPEGASHPWALPGAVSLGLDIVQEERRRGRAFKHILVDAGTGYAAQVLIAVLGTVAPDHHVHVVQMAGNPQTFKNELATVLSDWRRFAECDETAGAPYTLYEPSTARSFGATNRQVFAEVRRMAQEEGILVDPLYSAKLFLTARDLVPRLGAAEDVLIVHSGGAMALTGFAKDLFC